LQVSKVFSPAGISSFFEVCDHDTAGNPITDPARIGARGGGFAIARGVTAQVTIGKRERARIDIRINSRPAPDAQTTRSALEQLVNAGGFSGSIIVDIEVKVPIAAGFGTSAAGTLASCLALSDAADLPVSFNDLGRITHISEVLNRTGLGTTSALLCGGFVLVNEPGAPGIGLVDRLRFPEDHSVICAYLGPIQTRAALAKRVSDSRDIAAARATLDAIHKDPSLTTFLRESRKFGEQAGFETPRITRLISTMLIAGATGAAQNMIGEAVHGVVSDSRAAKVVKAVRRAFPDARVFTSPIDQQGVRLLKARAKH
jgi:pantoate kinase